MSKSSKQIKKTILEGERRKRRLLKAESSLDAEILAGAPKGIYAGTFDFVQNPDYAPKGGVVYNKFTTDLAQINKDPFEVENKINDLIDNKGREEISSKKELEDWPTGALVSYITTDGLYRSGGFLRKIEDEYFCLQGGTIAKPVSFCVQFENVDRMFVGSPIASFKVDESKKTNFPIVIGKKIVYYAKDNNDRRRFMNTGKYKRARKFQTRMNEMKGKPIMNKIEKRIEKEAYGKDARKKSSKASSKSNKKQKVGRPKTEIDFDVKLGNEVIYTAKTPSDKKRFLETKKFQRILRNKNIQLKIDEKKFRYRLIDGEITKVKKK